MSRLSSSFTDEPVALGFSQPTIDDNSIWGEVVYVDSFGNLVTNISAACMRPVTGRIRVKFQGKSVDFVATYGDAECGQVIALLGSSGWLEIAISGGNARETLKAEAGEAVHVVGA